MCAPLADVGAGAEARERADAGALADARADHVAVGQDLGAVLHHHAGAEEHVGLDDHVAADDRVEAEPHRLRRDQRGALLHGPAPGAPLEHGLGGGQLLARVDAHRLLGRAGDRPGDEPVAGGERDRVGQVVLALGVARCRCAPSSPARSGTRNAIAPALHRPMRALRLASHRGARGSP